MVCACRRPEVGPGVLGIVATFVQNRWRGVESVGYEWGPHFLPPVNLFLPPANHIFNVVGLQLSSFTLRGSRIKLDRTINFRLSFPGAYS